MLKKLSLGSLLFLTLTTSSKLSKVLLLESINKVNLYININTALNLYLFIPFIEECSAFECIDRVVGSGRREGSGKRDEFL